MPISKKTWQSIGNVVVGILIPIFGILCFYIFPSRTIHDMEPYTGTAASAIQELHYLPYYIPLGVALFVVGCYYHFGRSIRQACLALALVLGGASLCLSFVYAVMEQIFLGEHIVYEGKCTARGFGVQVNENTKMLYAKFSCDDDPDYVFKVWDPDIIAYAANHPNNRSALYQLSARDTLVPVEKAR